MKYFIVATAVLVKDNKFLILKRKKGIHANKWSFPGGKVKKGEDLIKALKREVKEETNLDIENIKKISEYEYKRPNGDITLGYCFSAVPKNTEVTEVILDKESLEFKWISKDELKNYDYIKEIEKDILKIFK